MTVSLPPPDMADLLEQVGQPVRKGSSMNNPERGELFKKFLPLFIWLGTEADRLDAAPETWRTKLFSSDSRMIEALELWQYLACPSNKMMIDGVEFVRVPQWNTFLQCPHRRNEYLAKMDEILSALRNS